MWLYPTARFPEVTTKIGWLIQSVSPVATVEGES